MENREGADAAGEGYYSEGRDRDDLSDARKELIKTWRAECGFFFLRALSLKSPLRPTSSAHLSQRGLTVESLHQGGDLP